MLLRQFDAQLLDEILALGGHALCDQLLADLSRCATLMRRGSLGTDDHDAPNPDQQRRDLHELRGIALTLGAIGLSDYCLETETRLYRPPDATALCRFDVIAEACDALREGILARRIGPA